MTGFGSVSGSPRVTLPFRYEAGTLILQLHVQPGAARSGWAGPHGEHALKLRLSAPALDGRANRACVQYLAKSAGVPRQFVTILHGEHTRDKNVRISPIDATQFRALKQQWQH